MQPTAAQHPSQADLAGFVLGWLNDNWARWIKRHLDECAACRTIIERTPTDSLVQMLKRANFTRIASPHGATPPVQGSVTKGSLPPPAPALGPDDVPPGLRNHPRYRIIRQLGQGGMGVVYQAEHRMMERLVAVKVINKNLLDHTEAVERFNREVRAAAKLDHPNIVKAFDAEQAGDLQLLAMEYVEGRSLADVLRKKRTLPVAYACQVVRQAALGLQHAHERGMVHRDLKPHNLMLTPRGVVKILDFGLAKLASERRTAGALTNVNALMGTPQYLAPEQARDSRSADIRADIYSLGCTLFHLLAGRPPFVGDTAIEIVVAQVEQMPPRINELRPDVPAPIADLVARMMAKDPAQRPQTPKDVAEGLHAFSKSHAASLIDSKKPATPFSEIQTQLVRVARFARPRFRQWIAVGLGFGFLAAIVLSLMFIKTPDGIVELDVPDNTEVHVNGALITLKQPDSGPIQVKVNKDKSTVTVLKDGVEVESRELTLSDKGKTVRMGWRDSLDEKTARPVAPSGDRIEDDESLLKANGGLDPRGMWRGWEAGTHSKTTIWCDEDGWHYRFTCHRNSGNTWRHVGSMTPIGGTIQDITPMMTPGYASGDVAAKDNKQRLTFDFETHGGGRQAGFDFKISEEAMQIKVDLLVQLNGNDVWHGIHVGRNGAVHRIDPPNATFTLPVFPRRK